jgi:hypothetical protein
LFADCHPFVAPLPHVAPRHIALTFRIAPRHTSPLSCRPCHVTSVALPPRHVTSVALPPRHVSPCRVALALVVLPRLCTSSLASDLWRKWRGGSAGAGSRVDYVVDYQFNQIVFNILSE